MKTGVRRKSATKSSSIYSNSRRASETSVSHRHRYAAKVEKGDNAWKEQWGGFISGLNLKRMGDNYGGVTLKASSDLQRAIEQHFVQRRQSKDKGKPEKECEYEKENEVKYAIHDKEEREQEQERESEDEMPALTFSYLFSSPAERKAAREAQKKEAEIRQRQELEERRRKRFEELERKRAAKMRKVVPKSSTNEVSCNNDNAASKSVEEIHNDNNNNDSNEEDDDDDNDDDDDEDDNDDLLLSKHQRALLEAQRRGLKLQNMTRKEKREFLHLTVSKEQQAAQERAKEFKLHELMDSKMAWYQQGPHPIDIIAEKLVTRKAEKKGKQLGLKYNYYLPHPSWVAKRAQHRKEKILVGLGRRLVFDDDGNAIDPLRNVFVNSAQVNLLLNDAILPASANVGEEVKTNLADTESSAKSNRDECVTNANDSTALQAIELTNVIVDPIKAQRSYVKAVVQNREAAMAIKKANLTTNFLSNNLVQGPSLSADDVS